MANGVVQASVIVAGPNMFSQMSEDLRTRYVKQQIKTPDALEFVANSEFLNEDPMPFHTVCLKTLYGLWLKYPPTRDELVLIDILRTEWGIDIDTNTDRRVNTLILVVGRRGRKSALTVYVAAYEAYKLICKFNPQVYYKIRPRHTIHIVHAAVSGNQAEEVFGLASDLVKRSPAFRDYIDFEKDNTTELRLFTPQDRLYNDQIDLRNSQLARGRPKENRLPGTIYVESITTSAKSSRGGSIICLMLTEFAHLERAKMQGGELLSSNPRSDYEVHRALKPSTKDFGDDFVEIMESTPEEKGGEFYHHYCLGGGLEIELGQGEERSPKMVGYQVVQGATWEVRPEISRESLESEFITDPVGARREYGAHFGNPGAQAVDERIVKSSIVPGKWLIRVNNGRFTFTISVDPGGKAKAKIGDVYAIGWSHREDKPDGRKKYVIDGFQGFRETIEATHDGRALIRPVNPHQVMTFILELIRDLGGRNWIEQIVYDQWESSEPITFLQALGIPAMETTFTNPYKSKMYGTFLGQLNGGMVELYEHDNENWIGIFLQEMKFLQQRTVGGTTFYSHPETGPVQNDDFADVAANGVYNMHILDNPTHDNMVNAMRKGHGPITLPQTFVPKQGPPIWGGAGPGMIKLPGRGGADPFRRR